MTNVKCCSRRRRMPNYWKLWNGTKMICSKYNGSRLQAVWSPAVFTSCSRGIKFWRKESDRAMRNVRQGGLKKKIRICLKPYCLALTGPRWRRNLGVGQSTNANGRVVELKCSEKVVLASKKVRGLNRHWVCTVRIGTRSRALLRVKVACSVWSGSNESK